MEHIRNGMPASDLHGVIWLKSRSSNSQGNCVELASLPGGVIGMRNSRHPSGPALIYTRAEIDAFIKGARDGDFDALITGPAEQPGASPIRLAAAPGTPRRPARARA